ncbi:MAG TPA: hypothetical protein VE986_03075 [Hyphomicrobiales bacterium]|nr:hypothetical protein [Hyphomicrobiales bacterium]
MRKVAVLGAGLALAAFALQAEARVKLKEACGADIEKFCKDVKKGRAACLRSHASELQPGCADALQQRDAEKAGKKQD